MKALLIIAIVLSFVACTKKSPKMNTGPTETAMPVEATTPPGPPKKVPKFVRVASCYTRVLCLDLFFLDSEDHGWKIGNECSSTAKAKVAALDPRITCLDSGGRVWRLGYSNTAADEYLCTANCYGSATGAGYGGASGHPY